MSPSASRLGRADDARLADISQSGFRLSCWRRSYACISFLIRAGDDFISPLLRTLEAGLACAQPAYFTPLALSNLSRSRGRRVAGRCFFVMPTTQASEHSRVSSQADASILATSRRASSQHLCCRLGSIILGLPSGMRACVKRPCGVAERCETRPGSPMKQLSVLARGG